MTKTNKIATFTVLSILGVIAAYLFYIYFAKFHEPSLEAYPIQGIDVSHQQHEIHWAALDKTKVKFVFIKATAGGDEKDENFQSNWIQAKKQNIIVGAYHFFSFCKTGEQQAKNFIETVPKEKSIKGMLPPAIDLEYEDNCKLEKSREEVLKELVVLERMLHEHYEQKPILYVTNDFLRDFLIGEFESNPIWIRSIFKEPEIAGGRAWTFWQHEHVGERKGIDGYVDLDVFKGTEADFDKLIGRTVEIHSASDSESH